MTGDQVKLAARNQALRMTAEFRTIDKAQNANSNFMLTYFETTLPAAGLGGIALSALTYRYAGRNFRLTDLRGHVPEEILA